MSVHTDKYTDAHANADIEIIIILLLSSLSGSLAYWCLLSLCNSPARDFKPW